MGSLERGVGLRPRLRRLQLHGRPRARHIFLRATCSSNYTLLRTTSQTVHCLLIYTLILIYHTWGPEQMRDCETFYEVVQLVRPCLISRCDTTTYMHGGRENYRCDKFIKLALGLTSSATGHRNQYAGRQRATINRRSGLGFNDAAPRKRGSLVAVINHAYSSVPVSLYRFTWLLDSSRKKPIFILWLVHWILLPAWTDVIYFLEIEVNQFEIK